MLNIIVTFILIAYVTFALDAGQSCLTAHKESATCVKLRDCSNLYKRLQEGYQSDNLKDYIINSKCNAEYTEEEYICCAERYRSKSLSTFNSIDLLPKPSDCGINGLSYSILGGKETQIDEHPWTVQLINYNGSYICGGALINERYVITAAHCAVLEGLERVRLGEWDMSVNPDCDVIGYCYPDFLEIEISTVSIPSSYFTSSHKPDIALLRLKRNVFTRINIRPICLPLDYSLRDNQLLDKRVTVIGWGVTETGYLSNRKLKANLTIRDLNVCNQKYRGTKMNTTLETDQLCAGGEEGIDTCDGDSGGPLIYATLTGKPPRLINYLVGITSYGPKKCGQKDWPAVYTHVGAHISWILNVIQP